MPVDSKGPVDECAESTSYPTAMNADIAVGIPFAPDPHRFDDAGPRAPSRSASVLSSVQGRHDDDLSTIMMRGATDLRNAKFELEEQGGHRWPD